jgi:hypothetical protein
MLPVYHRPHDAKLLLLTLPACAMLLSEGKSIGRIAIVLNSAAIVLTSDLPLALLSKFTGGAGQATDAAHGNPIAFVLDRPVPLVLLALGVFYLSVYIFRREESASNRGQTQPSLSEVGEAS